MPQNAVNLCVNNARKFQNFTISSISRFGDIKTENEPIKPRASQGMIFLNNREIPDHLIENFFSRV